MEYEITNLRRISVAVIIGAALLVFAANFDRLATSPFSTVVMATPTPIGMPSVAPAASRPIPTSDPFITPTQMSVAAEASQILTGKISFAQNDNGHSQVYVMNVDGSDVRKVSDDPNVDDTNPIFSPDGSRVAYLRQQGYNVIGLYVARVDNPSVKSYFDFNKLNVVTRWPAWSPDSHKIAVFLFNTVLVVTIDVVSGQLSAPLGPALDTAAVNYLAWSPDGQHFAFSTDEFRSIYATDAHGENRIALIQDGADGNFLCPTWSPDGKFLAFKAGGALFDDFEVMTLDKKIIAYENADQPDLLASSCPAWSADSKYIFFFSNREDYSPKYTEGYAASRVGNHYELYALEINYPNRLLRLTNNFPQQFLSYPGGQFTSFSWWPGFLADQK